MTNTLVKEIPKSTSYEYGEEYQKQQLAKYDDRKNNHWQTRIDLAIMLLEKHVLPKINNKEGLKIVDIGCSMGTIAVEIAKKGYKAFGIDFDEKAIALAKNIAKREGVQCEFIVGDVSDPNALKNKIDVGVCFDIFEHLHDDELGSLLSSLKKQFSDDGFLIYHTFPQEYDYIFYNNFLNFPLRFFTFLSIKKFDVLVKLYSKVLDVLILLKKGVDWNQRIEKTVHPNPLTKERLDKIMKRAGYEIVLSEEAQLYPYNKKNQDRFKKFPISCRNLYGIVKPKKTNK